MEITVEFVAKASLDTSFGSSDIKEIPEHGFFLHRGT